MKLSSFEKLQQIIAEDERHKDSRVVRFINVESLEYWCKVKNYLDSKCGNCIQLSEYCSSEDSTPNMNRVIKSLKSINSSTLLVPLSEHLRINRDENILSRIINLEFENLYNSYARLYIPFYRMSNDLNELIKSDPRIGNCVFYLETGVIDDDYSLIILPQKLSINIKGTKLNGYKKYLTYWESNPNMPIILHTDNAIYYKNFAFADNVKVIDSAYEILKYLKILSDDIDKSWGEDWCWRELLSNLEEDKPLVNVFMKYFGIKELNIGHLLNEWDKQKDFGKWLIWLWFKLETKAPYLKKVVEKCKSYSNLVLFLINTIFELKPTDRDYEKLYCERKEYLQRLNLLQLPYDFWKEIDSINPSEKIFRLTDCTDRERETIIGLFNDVKVDKKKMDFLKIAYPEILDYLKDYQFDNVRITDYFSEYKVHKLSNNFTEEFVDKVTKIAAEKGIWWSLGIESRNKIIDNYYTNKTKIIWVDGLGVEFLGLIQTLLDKNYPGRHNVIEIGYSTIPTITEINKDFVTDRQYQYIQDLDTLIHNGQFPGYISEQIILISNQIRNAVGYLDAFDKVIVTSDHGASRGTVLAKGNSIKALESCDSIERDGRYCVDKTNKYESLYDTCIDMSDYHVFASYDRFSVQGSAKNENHGGASLEEVLVPVIVLSNRPLQESVNIELITPEVRIQLGKVTIKFRLDKDFNKISAFVGNKKYDCVKKEDYWYFLAECDQRTEYKARIVSKGTIGTLSYKVNKGRSDNKNFDI